MSAELSLQVAKKLVEALGSGQTPDTIAALFHMKVVFELPGDIGALPWIGRDTGREAIASFISGSRTLIEQDEFTVQDILASETRAAIVGTLTARVVATDRLIRSSFAIILTVSEGLITHFLMLEDSFAVSRAARP